MKRSIRLFIGRYEADFKSVPDVLYTFKVDEVTSPSVSRNTFSKTVSLPGTERNNRIFGQFWASDRITGNNFDASRKTPFTLYVDSEVYQSGYCKLNEIVQNKNDVTYSVTLYGGLGEFFSNLTYKGDEAGDDEKKKISDLDFFAGDDSDTPLELGFVINKETIADAWANIDGYSSKWHVINFAPAYNGLPSDFDANKVLMNCESVVDSGSTGGRVVRRTGGRGSVVTTSVTEDDKTYATYGGYALAELSRDYVESEMREFRSYLQRPVLNVQRTIEAICRPENNGGWEVYRDADWFRYDNCYWTDLWCTLPMLSALEYNASFASSSVTVSLGNKATGTIPASSTADPAYYEDNLAILSDSDSGYAFDVQVKVSLDALGINDTTEDKLVVCAYPNYAGAVIVQLVAYDAGGHPVAGSDEYYITSAYGIRRVSEGGRSQVYTYFIPRDTWKYTPPYGDGFVRAGSPGYFQKVSGDTYRWDEEITLTAKNVPGGSTLKILVTDLYKSSNTPSSPKILYYRWERPGESTIYQARTFTGFNVTINSSKVAFKTNDGIRTGAEFTKKQLLDTDYTPAEFLLSYAKIFGLYFLADPVKKKISILTRKNFFKRDEIVDIDRYIDRSNYKITPLVFDSKWYKWNLDADESEYGKAYEDTYGKSYGEQLVNTNYNFNVETKEVFDDNVFKGAVQVLERSDAYCYTGQDTTSKPWMFPGYKYLLYDTTDSTNSHEVEVNASSTMDAFSAFTEGYLYYDLFDKVQLHTADNSPADGKNVLLIRTGNKELSIGSMQLNYFITDDNSYMNILNSNRPCWLFTNSETDGNGNSIAVRATYAPYFSRYKIYEASGYITRSLDFGRPEEIYIPKAIYRPGSTIYEEFWKSYIKDLYSKDTRIVKTKMYFKEKPTVDWLRRFYWFDNAIWRMSSINDYNVAKDSLTEVEFVKVNDTANYTSVDVNEDVTVTVTLTPGSIGFTGGTVQYDITVSDGGAWYIDYWDSDTTVSASAGTGDYTGTWTIPANNYTGDIQRMMIVMADNSSVRVYLTQTGVRLGISGPAESGDVYWTGGTRTFTLVSPDSNWSAKTDYAMVTSISPAYGTPTTSSGVTITATIGENSGSTTREAYLYAETPNGATARSGYMRQGVQPSMYISVSPARIDDFSATGGTIQLTIQSSEGWHGYRNQSWVSLSPTSGTAGTSVVTVTVDANTSFTDSRYVYLSFYREGSPASNPANCILTQKAAEHSYADDYLTFRIVSGGTMVWKTGNANYIPQYSIDSGATWQDITNGINTTKTLNVNAGDAIMLKNYNTSAFYGSSSYDFMFTSASTATFDVEGNIMSLVYGDSFSANTALTQASQFSCFFQQLKVRSAKNLVLPSTTTTRYAYAYMFSGSTITEAPAELPADTIENYAYREMFAACTNLTTAPKIKATSVGEYGCSYMFQGCTGLLEAPDFAPASVATRGCLRMFRDCTSMATVPASLPASATTEACYSGMFSGCTSITESPELPAAYIERQAYSGMFAGCSNLSSIKCYATGKNTSTGQYHPCYNWVSGVAADGTFTKQSTATFWETGTNGIPSGWSVVDA